MLNPLYSDGSFHRDRNFQIIMYFRLYANSAGPDEMMNFFCISSGSFTICQRTPLRVSSIQWVKLQMDDVGIFLSSISEHFYLFVLNYLNTHCADPDEMPPSGPSCLGLHQCSHKIYFGQ